MKQLQIIKCSDPQMWYADLIGERVPLLQENADGFLSREPAGFTNIVKREDAQVVDDEF